MSRLPSPPALLAIVAIVFGACASADAADTVAAGPRVVVELLDMKFAPALIEVPAGEAFTLEVRNAGKIEHDLTIDALHFKVIVKAGRSATRVLGPLPPALTYPVVCSIFGHKEAGMIGKLVTR